MLIWENVVLLLPHSLYLLLKGTQNNIVCLVLCLTFVLRLTLAVTKESAGIYSLLCLHSLEYFSICRTLRK